MSGLALFALLLLVVVNGVFVAAEFALVRARRERLEALAEEGSRGAQLTLGQLDRIDEYLSACQVGITIASLGIGALIEPGAASLIEPIFGGISHGVAVTISVAIAFVLVTGLHISAGEQGPKMLAISRPDGAARVLSRPLAWFRLASAPFTLALTWLSNAMLRLLGVRRDEIAQEKHTSEDLKVLISQSAVGGDLDPGEAALRRGVFHPHEH